MGEVVPPILSAEEVETYRVLDYCDALIASHEALRAEVLRLREALTALLDCTRLDDRRATAAETAARALLVEGSGVPTAPVLVPVEQEPPR